ncbi:hypothetical protein [Rhodococcus sp. JVH1]|uniref:hypothetical protein n=1 Tax=Rhodococcus sp. JVH1 TaxID=745408 RepID=UPI000271EA29|nr:hypothetical protein [Rhodococcus sp. JVH1]EJI98623.1 hypothetical protein JVH1_3879 [Rhodococcus sp. JVH1]
MSPTYAAHIVTSDAVALGDPEILVMTAPDEPGLIASYPLADDEAPEDVLAANGWRVTSGDTPTVEMGYRIVEVEAVDWEQIVKHVTFAKAQAEIEAGRQDLAWRTALRDAMRAGGSATRLAGAAGVSRERVYQIRDGRR